MCGLWSANGIGLSGIRPRSGRLMTVASATELQVEPGVVRVVVADDSVLVREGLEHLLSDVPALRLIAICADATTLLEVVEREHPDVVVTDIRMPPTHQDEGIQVARRLRDAHPDIGVVVLSQYDNPSKYDDPAYA